MAPPPPLPDDLPFVPIGHPDTMMSKESVRRAVEEFVVRPSDVIVATFSKTGTTLVTWICHLLRTNGGDSFDFSAIQTLYEVVPWPLLSYDIGYDPNTCSGALFPRVFKSHLRMASVYRGCKYIVTIRDPAKTTLSFYNFLASKKVPSVLAMDVSTFLTSTSFVKGREGRASLWEYYKEYHILRDCEAMLVICYEDLVKNKKAWIPVIASFMGLEEEEITPSLVSKVIEKSSKEFMGQRNSLFDEPYERAKSLGRAGDLSQLAPGTKVATQVHTQKLNQNANDFLRNEWEKTMAPLGYSSYEVFAADFKKRNEKRFGVTGL